MSGRKRREALAEARQPAAARFREDIRKAFMAELIAASRTSSRFDVFSRWLQYAQARDMLALLTDAAARQPFVAEKDEALRRSWQPDEGRFERMRSLLTGWFTEASPSAGDGNTGADLLGQVYMDAALGNRYAGQFFTPWSVAAMMAGMSVGAAAAPVRERGYISLREPSCGSGVMLLAAAESLRNQGLDLPRQTLFVAADLDIDCCRMAWLQMARSGIPGIVLWANSLTQDIHRKWGTPALALFVARHEEAPLTSFTADVVLANPPFGGKVSRRQAFAATPM